MLLRSIVSRIHLNQRFANFCSLKNVGPQLASPENAQSPEKGYVVSYLMSSCGLSPENAISASKNLRFDSPEKPNAVLDFLQKQGFTKTQIAELVRGRPQLLLSTPEKSILPKIEFFSRFTGVPEKDVITTVSKYPHLLAPSLEHRLAPIFGYLRDLIGTEKVVTLFRRGSWAFRNFNLEEVIPNVDLLREIGVPPSFIKFSVYHYPQIFSRKHVEFREVVEEVKQMGFDPQKSTFVLALHARMGKASLALWDKCYEVYSKWGWSKDDILMAFRRHPSCMVCSEKKITMVLEFVVNELGREARSLARCPNMIFLNMERRTVPRCSVVHLLSLKGLVRRDWSFSSVLCPVEKIFLNRYVTRYTKELPELYDFYLSKKAGVGETQI